MYHSAVRVLHNDLMQSW